MSFDNISPVPAPLPLALETASSSPAREKDKPKNEKSEKLLKLIQEKKFGEVKILIEEDSKKIRRVLVKQTIRELTKQPDVTKQTIVDWAQDVVSRVDDCLPSNIHEKAYVKILKKMTNLLSGSTPKTTWDEIRNSASEIADKISGKKKVKAQKIIQRAEEEFSGARKDLAWKETKKLIDSFSKENYKEKLKEVLDKVKCFSDQHPQAKQALAHLYKVMGRKLLEINLCKDALSEASRIVEIMPEGCDKESLKETIEQERKLFEQGDQAFVKPKRKRQ